MRFHRFALGVGLVAAAFAASGQSGNDKTYIVELADAPAATYGGAISGLAATRPAPGAKLNASSTGVRAYENYLNIQQSKALALVGNVPALHRYSITFNGFSARLSDAQVQALKRSASVKSVTESEIRKLDTTRTPGFLGINAPGGVWSQVDSLARQVKGEDVIIGMIDSGVWPENPSFGDKVNGLGAPVAYHQAGTPVYTAPPAKWQGTCQTGGGFTSAMCNNKLIGARYYNASFKARVELNPFEYESPRDGGGHGTHTASTAGGNAGVEASVNGTAIGAISGMAPRARLAVYKVCWEAKDANQTGCSTADTLKAIDDAVKDGVDVINYSVSGTQTNFLDAVEVAYLNAAAAGVFVAASAGNSGPGNTVAHISPWITTVGNSTHDRVAVANVNLGNGSAYTGASVFKGTLASAPMVLSSTIPVPSGSAANANLCFLNSLAPALAAGKIVVCDRGTNARVEKSAEVKRAGGVGMVLINVSSAANDLAADFHSVPSVHLDVATRTAVRAYVGGAGATGGIAPPAVLPVAIAPVMNNSSSRGPNQANGNILKPDITAPGTDVLAGYLDTSLTQAQHDSLVVGGFTPAANANSLTGTSMSSPHVAGVAALFKQLYPSWSPAAIKSAMMTSTTDVKLANGSPDANRWGFGAGHMSPNAAANPGLVYDTTPADYGRFLCGLGLTPPPGIGSCATLGSVQPWNLNLASLTASAVPGSLTFTRRVTNTSSSPATYSSSASLPGWHVVVAPANFLLAPGASTSFTVTVTSAGAAAGSWSFGALVWSDGVRQVRSPLSVRGVAFVSPALVSDTRVSGRGSKVYSITANYTGAMSVLATGLVPATLTLGNVAQNAQQCFDFSLPAGAQFARFQTFNTDTSGGAATDIDLVVYQGSGGTGPLVGASGVDASDELVTLMSPASGTYSACVEGYSVPASGAAFTLSSWIVGPAAGTQTLRASGPTSVYAGGSASIGLGWAVTAGKRYMGNVQYRNSTGIPLGSTMVFVDNH